MSDTENTTRIEDPKVDADTNEEKEVDATTNQEKEVDATRIEEEVTATRIEEDPTKETAVVKNATNVETNEILKNISDEHSDAVAAMSKVEGEALVFFDLIKPIFGLILNFIPEKAWKTTANSVLTKICEIVRDAETATPSDPPISGCEIKMEIVKKVNELINEMKMNINHERMTKLLMNRIFENMKEPLDEITNKEFIAFNTMDSLLSKYSKDLCYFLITYLKSEYSRSKIESNTFLQLINYANINEYLGAEKVNRIEETTEIEPAATSTNTSAAATNTPAAATNTPAAATNTPAEQTSATNTSSAETNTLAVEENTSAAEKNTSAGNMIGGDDPTSSAQSSAESSAESSTDTSADTTDTSADTTDTSADTTDTTAKSSAESSADTTAKSAESADTINPSDMMAIAASSGSVPGLNAVPGLNSLVKIGTEVVSSFDSLVGTIISKLVKEAADYAISPDVDKQLYLTPSDLSAKIMNAANFHLEKPEGRQMYLRHFEPLISKSINAISEFDSLIIPLFIHCLRNEAFGTFLYKNILSTENGFQILNKKVIVIDENNNKQFENEIVTFISQLHEHIQDYFQDINPVDNIYNVLRKFKYPGSIRPVIPEEVVVFKESKDNEQNDNYNLTKLTQEQVKNVTPPTVVTV